MDCRGNGFDSHLFHHISLNPGFIVIIGFEVKITIYICGCSSTSRAFGLGPKGSQGSTDHLHHFIDLVSGVCRKVFKHGVTPIMTY